MSNLSERDKGLSPADQQKIIKAKEAYAKATTQAERDAAHAAAEAVRSNYGYTGGKTGSNADTVDLTDTYAVGSVNGGTGRTAAEMRTAMEEYHKNNLLGGGQYYGPGGGWTNGYSTAMNTRSKANEIRQQMAANDELSGKINDEAYKDYLHQQNLALAEVLYDYTGHTKKTTYYNDKAKRWETWNPDIGYGYDMNGTQSNIRDAWKKYYGYTDAEIENWANDTSHYYNFVDVRAPARNTIDESSGFTGEYAQFVNGPYSSLMSGSREYNGMAQYADVIGDGFGSEGTFTSVPQYDENGNIIKYAPQLKNNNDATAYSAQHMPRAVNGVLTKEYGGASAPLTSEADPHNVAGQLAYYNDYKRYTNNYGGSGSGSVSGYEGYLQQLYASALEAQLKALESGYTANLSELDAGQTAIDGVYTEQKRQTSGESARESAAWREVANAYGLNSGAVGQASLAQRNQLQSDLNKLNAAQASARTELQRQRLLLGQQYQLAIQQAVAENQSELAKSLYEEAVRAEEALRQQEQFYANLALQYGKSMMSFAKSSGSGSSREAEFNIIEDAVRNGFISDAQGKQLAQYFGFV